MGKNKDTQIYKDYNLSLYFIREKGNKTKKRWKNIKKKRKEY